MAITKIWKVKNRLSRSIEYILNPDKTGIEFDADSELSEEKYIMNNKKSEHVLYVRAYNCSIGEAAKRMFQTQERFGKDKMKRGVVAYHLVQSFKDFETTPEVARKCGLELAERLFSDKYEVVVATHIDHKHLHIVT